MITDWSKQGANWVFNAGPGRVTPVAGGYYVASYNGEKLGQWLSEQNAMLMVEMKHREVKTAKEAAALEEAGG